SSSLKPSQANAEADSGTYQVTLRSPALISIEEVRDFIHHLITQRKVAFSTCNLRLAGIRSPAGERLFAARLWEHDVIVHHSQYHQTSGCQPTLNRHLLPTVIDREQACRDSALNRPTAHQF